MEIGFQTTNPGSHCLTLTLLLEGPQSLLHAHSQPYRNKLQNLGAWKACHSAWQWTLDEIHLNFFLQVFKFTEVVKEPQRSWGLNLSLCGCSTEKHRQSWWRTRMPPLHQTHAVFEQRMLMGGKDGSVVKSSSPKCLLMRLKVSTPTQRGQVAPILSAHIHLIMGRYSN